LPAGRGGGGGGGGGGEDSEGSGGSPAAEDYIELVRDVARQRQRRHKYALLLGDVPPLARGGGGGGGPGSAEPLPSLLAVR
jgi:hypothetical protein